MSLTQSCKSCKWLDVPADKRGRLYARKGHAYRCIVPIAMPVLPASVRHYSPPKPGYMEPGEGRSCKLYAQRESNKVAPAAPKFNGLDPKTNALVDINGKPRPPGADPVTGLYSTAQSIFDEAYGGDTSQPLDD